MMRFLVVSVVSCLASACASGDDAAMHNETGDAGALGTFASQNGAYQIEVHTGPDQPPTRGLSTVDLMVTDSNTGDPSDELQLDVVPWMPAMGHGTSVKPDIQAAGGGHYVISRVNMYMGGAWDLRISMTGAESDRATLHFTIR